jgi:hypothetical protein
MGRVAMITEARTGKNFMIKAFYFSWGAYRIGMSALRLIRMVMLRQMSNERKRKWNGTGLGRKESASCLPLLARSTYEKLMR